MAKNIHDVLHDFALARAVCIGLSSYDIFFLCDSISDPASAYITRVETIHASF